MNCVRRRAVTLQGRATIRLLATAALTAVAFLFVVHRAIFAALFAALFFRCKRGRANHRRDNRHQDFRCDFHLD
jgi:hypothetical protein